MAESPRAAHDHASPDPPDTRTHDPEGAGQYAPAFARHNGVLRIRESPEEVVVGTCTPATTALRTTLESFHRKRVVFTPVSPSRFATDLAKLTLNERPISFDPTTAHRQRLDRVANEAPVVNLVDGLLLRALDADASDIHVELTADCSTVRFRVDGRLSVVERLAPSLFPALSTRIKLLAGLNIMERRLPQDGRVTVALHGTKADVRVSTVPTHTGESIVIRVFPAASPSASLEELGFPPPAAAELRAAVALPAGLLLTTGPTGSGKSTTLASLLHLLATDDRKIVTIEDPVEQVIPGAVQLQTDDRIDLSFDRLLRHVLRQDPNVVMVGEIRDMPTCELALRASLTGHLILSSLHTNGAVAAVDRLRNLGVPAYLIGEVLQASLAQRLVRRLCPQCRVEATPTVGLARALDERGLARRRSARAVGCPACNGTGYRGRIPIIELFIPTDETREMIASGASSSQIVAYEAARGRRSLLRDGLEKVARGLTTLDELRTAVEVPW